MAFEKFTMSGRSFAPKVSIWSRGQIGFNNGAVNRFKLDRFDYVIFHFDKDEQKIGLQFTTNKDEDGAVKLNKRTTGISVGAKSFFDYYGVDYAVTTQYSVGHDKENDLYVIDLKEKMAPEKDK